MRSVMKKTSLLLAAVLIQALAADTAQAQRIPVTQIDTFSFGRFAAGPTGGTVALPANGGVSTTGSVVHLNGEQKGLVTVQANAGDTIEVRVRNGAVNGPGPRMRFRPNCIGPGGVLGQGRCRFTATGGVDSVLIGGELINVRNETSQTAGLYTGTLRIVARVR